jgi:hypothetical protein
LTDTEGDDPSPVHSLLVQLTGEIGHALADDA